MARVVCSLVVWLIACAPDTAHTAFVCGDDSECPADQHCFSSRCRRAEVQGDGIQCGAMTCEPTAQCCLDGQNPPHCIRAGDRCPGLGALCDSRNDCMKSDHCCADDSILSCNTDCAEIACQSDDDCTTVRLNCCHRDPSVPWGTCSIAPC